MKAWYLRPLTFLVLASVLLSVLSGCGSSSTPVLVPSLETLPTDTAAVPATYTVVSEVPVASVIVPTEANPTDNLVVDGGRRLLVLHTNDVMGYVDPCG